MTTRLSTFPKKIIWKIKRRNKVQCTQASYQAYLKSILTKKNILATFTNYVFNFWTLFIYQIYVWRSLTISKKVSLQYQKKEKGQVLENLTTTQTALVAKNNVLPTFGQTEKHFHYVRRSLIISKKGSLQYQNKEKGLVLENLAIT